MVDKQIIINGVDVSGWTDEEVYYKFEHHSSKDIKQIAFDLYKQLKRKEQSLEKIKLMLQTIIETNKIYPLQNNLLKLLDIIEGKENE